MRTRLAAAALLSVTAVWGSTFFLIKDLLDRVPAPDFLAVRFAIAFTALFLLAPRAISRLSPQMRRRSALRFATSKDCRQMGSLRLLYPWRFRASSIASSKCNPRFAK